MKCNSCKWWGMSPESLGASRKNMDDNPLRQCGMPKFKYGYRYKFTDIPEDGAMIEYDEGWGMFTGAKFGCVHWEGEL